MIPFILIPLTSDPGGLFPATEKETATLLRSGRLLLGITWSLIRWYCKKTVGIGISSPTNPLLSHKSFYNLTSRECDFAPDLCFTFVRLSLPVAGTSIPQTPVVLLRSRKMLVSPGAGHGPGLLLHGGVSQCRSHWVSFCVAWNHPVKTASRRTNNPGTQYRFR